MYDITGLLSIRIIKYIHVNVQSIKDKTLILLKSAKIAQNGNLLTLANLNKTICNCIYLTLK